MPELPEVETVVRGLRPMLVGQRFGAVTVGRKRLRQTPWPKLGQLLPGRLVGAIHRRGKWIIIELDSGRLLVHLGMTGQLTIGPATRPLLAHTHFRADLPGQRQLRFRDVRRFGSMTWFAEQQSLDDFLAARLGPEPFELKANAWRASLANAKRPVKALLLDQAVVAGVGNIYADESLFQARIHPMTRADRLTRPQADALRRAVARVLTFAIERRGSSIRDYLDGAGVPGEFQNEFRVYGRTGKPCLRCRAPIERVRCAGRSTHFCGRCQN